MWRTYILYMYVISIHHVYAAYICYPVSADTLCCALYLLCSQATATRSNTLQHAATHCNTLQHAVHSLCWHIVSWGGYGLLSRLLKTIGLFCKRALQKRLFSAKETCNFKEPTNHIHPIRPESRSYRLRAMDTLQHTATHCNTLQHTTAHCNALQHTVTNCNTLQHTVKHCNTRQHTVTHRNTPQHTITQCNTLQPTATHHNTL